MGIKQRAQEYLRRRSAEIAEEGARGDLAWGDDLARGDLAEDARGGELSASLVIICTDRRGMLVDVASVVTEGVTNILSVHTDIFVSGGRAELVQNFLNRRYLEDVRFTSKFVYIYIYICPCVKKHLLTDAQRAGKERSQRGRSTTSPMLPKNV